MTTKCRRQILLSLSGGVLRRTWALLVGILLLGVVNTAEAQALLNPPVLVTAGSTLQWSPPLLVVPEGYLLSCGTESGTYPIKTFLSGPGTSVGISAGLVTAPGASVPVTGGTFLCIVQAQNITGVGPASNEAAFLLPPVPPGPTNLRVVP